jgi:hypothetical protein
LAWKDKDKNTGLYFENKDEGLIKEGKAHITRIFKKNVEGNVKSVAFGSIGVGAAMLPDSFADEYYLRAIPFLRKIGVEEVTITAMTTAENPEEEAGRYIGAFIWPRYGYTNQDMNGTINDLLNWLKEDRKLNLDAEHIDYIKSMKCMRKLADYEVEINGKDVKVGSSYLLGDDGTGKFTRDILWIGVIPNINKLGSDEMLELSDRLADFRHK